jgi:hypothetical protein
MSIACALRRSLRRLAAEQCFGRAAKPKIVGALLRWTMAARRSRKRFRRVRQRTDRVLIRNVFERFGSQQRVKKLRTDRCLFPINVMKLRICLVAFR